MGFKDIIRKMGIDGGDDNYDNGDGFILREHKFVGAFTNGAGDFAHFFGAFSHPK